VQLDRRAPASTPIQPDVVTLVRITGVHQAPEDPRLHGARIEEPATGDTSDTYSFRVLGWSLGAAGVIRQVRLMQRGRLLREVPITAQRSDVEREFPGVSGAERSGFGAMISALDLDQRFSITLEAVLDGGDSALLGSITGERAPLRASSESQLQPILVTTIGRSGSKWLTWLLSCHPEIIAYQPLVFEPRVLTYWVAVLRALAMPQSYLRQLHAPNWQRLWWLGEGATNLPESVDEGVASWLGHDAVESLATLARDRTSAFYEKVADQDGRLPRYFVEKVLLDPTALNLATEIFPSAREVILVRDFRDRLSSVLAWDHKRSEYGFGRDASTSIEEYVTDKVQADARSLLARWRERESEAHLVRYEDLVLDPVTSLVSLFRYLGLHPDDEEAATQLIQRASEAGALLDAHRTIRDPAESIGRWKHDLPEPIAELCDDVLSPELTAFGYSAEARLAS
jgi:hypothetical protein